VAVRFSRTGTDRRGRVLPGLPSFFSELDSRFATLSELLAGRISGDPPRTARLEADPAALQRLAGFDRAAIAVARKEMERMEALTATLLECALELGEVLPAPARGNRCRVPLCGAGRHGCRLDCFSHPPRPVASRLDRAVGQTGTIPPVSPVLAVGCPRT